MTFYSWFCEAFREGREISRTKTFSALQCNNNCFGTLSSRGFANPISWISIMEYCEDGYESTMHTKGLFAVIPSVRLSFYLQIMGKYWKKFFNFSASEIRWKGKWKHLRLGLLETLLWLKTVDKSSSEWFESQQAVARGFLVKFECVRQRATLLNQRSDVFHLFPPCHTSRTMRRGFYLP